MTTLKCNFNLTLTLSGFKVLNDANSIIQNWLVSKLFTNNFHHLNFADEHELQFYIIFHINLIIFILTYNSNCHSKLNLKYKFRGFFTMT